MICQPSIHLTLRTPRVPSGAVNGGHSHGRQLSRLSSCCLNVTLGESRKAETAQTLNKRTTTCAGNRFMYWTDYWKVGLEVSADTSPYIHGLKRPVLITTIQSSALKRIERNFTSSGYFPPRNTSHAHRPSLGIFPGRLCRSLCHPYFHLPQLYMHRQSFTLSTLGKDKMEDLSLPSLFCALSAHSKWR